MLLEIKGLTKQFGGLAAVTDLALNVGQGEIVGLLGPNGAGKSTTFNLITGIHRPSAGTVLLDGVDITGRPPHVIARRGIGRTFQHASLFPEFTVLENVVSSFYLHPKCGFLEAVLNTGSYRRKEKEITEHALEILQLVGLEKVAHDKAGNLPHGYQKILGVARAVAVRPKLLLLDEPIAGMTHDEIEFSLGAFAKINARGTAILLVEHNMEIMRLCQRLFVINFGRNIAHGTPAEVRCNEEVINAYFGDTTCYLD